ncbi:glyoxylase-like metal-dependent hydrolase (beta-lactamase superfamily II) [Hydrogenophaga palleronii]|uniref:Glyoxylase-like metal-dependent hydrolase (Beta-lactamase superfamily II) n=1 Tax=Hydrogenophaga palleronii TaxID=65655 RepID=A0ABU1WN45_9BURK|nr:MBL fold metallo-hydrolase [Hydrogenophaga palleronii]MDR7150726.1 glyoxylase-like metal-dependent hydrolase (beta-lactamase superfamily II) [Hydrogenophaga palleronii]
MFTMLADLEQAGITVFERGWLSSNNILIQGSGGPSALVDSGYVSHAEQTLNLVRSALNGRPLDLLLNTHLHSDHCGGNSLLQSSYPDLCTLIPPGLASAVSEWDPVALTFEPTGQSCTPFSFEELLLPGSTLQLGSLHWQVHAAQGHDPHSVILFQPQYRILISADALWENGFGVVFPELEGLEAFQDVANTLDTIEQLAPLTVIPGHGSIFQDLPTALSKARSRLAGFIENPDKHKRHALKVLLKFKLLEWQQIHRSALAQWCQRTPYITRLASDGNPTPLSVEDFSAFLVPLLKELERSGALRLEEDFVFNS